MMPIKMIAVDMDGTFLNSKSEYDRERFYKQYERLTSLGIRFVVASGNQYFQLKSFFNGIVDELGFVAENGSYVIDRGVEIFAANLPKEDALFITDTLLKIPGLAFILCGKKCAYILEDDVKPLFAPYYHRIELVNNYDEVDDQFFKISIICNEDEGLAISRELETKVGHIVEIVRSGTDSIDLGIHGINKATGIKYLQEHLNIKPDEIMAFGDSENDLEMLKYVQYSFAMDNGFDSVKKVAKYIAPSNDENGVLEVIDHLLDEDGDFSKYIK